MRRFGAFLRPQQNLAVTEPKRWSGAANQHLPIRRIAWEGRGRWGFVQQKQRVVATSADSIGLPEPAHRFLQALREGFRFGTLLFLLVNDVFRRA